MNDKLFRYFVMEVHENKLGIRDVMILIHFLGIRTKEFDSLWFFVTTPLLCSKLCVVGSAPSMLLIISVAVPVDRTKWDARKEGKVNERPGVHTIANKKQCDTDNEK